MNKREIFAEVGSVHDGSIGNALNLVKAIGELGGDAVKFQLHIADSESTKNAPSPTHFETEDRGDYFDRLAFSPTQWRQIRSAADDAGIKFICSPFSTEAVDILESVGVAGYKVASGELTNLPLLQEIAATNKPVYLSTGMANWDEIDRAVSTLGEIKDLTILQCTTLYPCPPEKVGLNVISEIAARYGRPVGLSDHTLGISASLAAIALGATCVEKHVTFSRRMYGSDAPFAIELPAFHQLVLEVRSLEAMLEHPVDKDDIREYAGARRVYQKSIVAAIAIERGTVIALEHLAFKKPGNGIPPGEYPTLLGRRVTRRIDRDEPIMEGDIE